MNASNFFEEGLGIKIDENIREIIDAGVSFVEFPCKHIVLLEGTQSANLYFILRGIVRGYYIDEKGNDITKCFCSEKEFFSSEGLRTGSVSSFTIECLEADEKQEYCSSRIHKPPDAMDSCKYQDAGCCKNESLTFIDIKYVWPLPYRGT